MTSGLVFRILFAVGLAFGSSTHAWSQMRAAVPLWQAWDGPDLVSFDPGISGSEVTVERAGKQLKIFKMPPQVHFMGIQDGVLYGIQRDRVSQSTKFWKSIDRVNWEKFGEMPYSEAQVVRVSPLKNGKFLLIGGFWPIKKGDSASFFAVSSANEKGEVRVDQLIHPSTEIPLCEKTWVTSPQTGKITPQWQINPKYNALNQMLFWPTIPVSGTIVLPSLETGLLFVFSEENGRFLRLIRLYSSVDEDRLKTAAQSLEYPILCLQPTREGRLIIASRTEDAVLNSRTIFETKTRIPPAGATPSELSVFSSGIKKDHGPILKANLEAFPEVLYWSLDPETGDKFLMSPAKGMPGKLYSLDIFKQFRFRMNPKSNRPELN